MRLPYFLLDWCLLCLLLYTIHPSFVSSSLESSSSLFFTAHRRSTERKATSKSGCARTKTIHYTTQLLRRWWRRAGGAGGACSTEGKRGAPSGGVVVPTETAAAKKKELLAARWRTSSSSSPRPRLQLESNSVDFKVRWRKERAAAWELFRHKSKFSTTCCYCHARRLIASVRYIFLPKLASMRSMEFCSAKISFISTLKVQSVVF